MTNYYEVIKVKAGHYRYKGCDVMKGYDRIDGIHWAIIGLPSDVKRRSRTYCTLEAAVARIDELKAEVAR